MLGSTYHCMPHLNPRKTMFVIPIYILPDIGKPLELDKLGNKLKSAVWHWASYFSDINTDEKWD